jgi:hypothetical protein
MPDHLKHCPRCRGEVRRVHRHLSDRIVNLVTPIHRYRCRNSHCGWEGNINDTRVGKRKKPLPKLTLVIMVTFAVLVLGTCSIKFIERLAGSQSAQAE